MPEPILGPYHLNREPRSTTVTRCGRLPILDKSVEISNEDQAYLNNSSLPQIEKVQAEFKIETNQNFQKRKKNVRKKS